MVTSSDGGDRANVRGGDPPLEFGDVLQQEFEAIAGAKYTRAAETVEREAAGLQGLEKQHAIAHGIQPWALCLSGGGIRSASFNLGILQGLAKNPEPDGNNLTKFDYLSTVSGGGYIGSWLWAAAKHHARGLEGALDDLRARNGQSPEAEIIRRLRDYSNFIAPKIGLLSADNWTFAATFLRNLFLNWIVLVPLLMAVLLVPRLAVALLSVQPPAVLQQVLLVGGFAAGCVSVMYMTLCQPKAAESLQKHRFWLGRRSEKHHLEWCLAPVLAATVQLSWWVWMDAGRHGVLDYGIFGAAIGLTGVVLAALQVRPMHFEDLLTGALAGLAAGASSWWVAGRLAFEPIWFVCLFGPSVLLALVASGSVLLGFASRWRRVEEEDREWHARTIAWFLIAAAMWMALSGLDLLGPEMVLSARKRTLFTGSLSTLAAAVLGAGPWTQGSTGSMRTNGLRVLLSRYLVPTLSFVSLVGILLGLAIGVTALAKAAGVSDSTDGRWWGVGLLLGVLLAAGLLGSAILNINKFSLHAAYRSRLVRAFLGVSRLHERSPNPFTGFDAKDDLRMYQLHPLLLTLDQVLDCAMLARGLATSTLVSAKTREDCRGIQAGKPVTRRLQYTMLNELNEYILNGDARAGPARHGFEDARARRLEVDKVAGAAVDALPAEWNAWKLFPVVNVAMNLVAGTNLAWQQRKAAPFTFSALHAGTCDRYRRAREYGGDAGVSLGMAMAISGAAVSPNMGYYTSSPMVSFLLTLLNVRLGWWLGNPATDKYGSKRPWTLSIAPLIREALGRTHDRSPYVYLSDGGHFDNLGLYEMVRRRCHFILIGDASEDRARRWSDLGRAIRKIRIDLGIEIEVAPTRSPDPPYRYGTIKYGSVDRGAPDGYLVVVKASVPEGAPEDVLEYKRTHDAFPHETTLDQFFSESQFESYRRLGQHLVSGLPRLAGLSTGRGGDWGTGARAGEG